MPWTDEQKLSIFEKFKDDFDFRGNFEFDGIACTNIRGPHNFTPLQAGILVFQQEDRDQPPQDECRAPVILEILLSLGADAGMNIPHNVDADLNIREISSGNAIAFAAAKGVLQACEIMYKHNPDIVNVPTGDGLQLNAFSIALLYHFPN